MFAKANNNQKFFLFISGIATKYYIIGHFWFIFGHYCSNKKYEKLKSLYYRFFAIYFLSDVTDMALPFFVNVTASSFTEWLA